MAVCGGIHQIAQLRILQDWLAIFIAWQLGGYHRIPPRLVGRPGEAEQQAERATQADWAEQATLAGAQAGLPSPDLSQTSNTQPQPQQL